MREFALRDTNLRSSGLDRHFQDADGLPGLNKTDPIGRLMSDVIMQPTTGQFHSEGYRRPGSLDFRYVTLHLPAKSKAKQVTIDFSSVGPNIDVDFLVHPAGQEAPQPLEYRSPGDKKLDICRDDSGDDIDSVTVVLSDHSLRGEQPRDGTFSYKTTTSCGGSGLHGALSLREGWSGHLDTPATPCDPGSAFDTYNWQSTWSGDLDAAIAVDAAGNQTNTSSSTLAGDYSFTHTTHLCDQSATNHSEGHYQGAARGIDAVTLSPYDGGAEVTIHFKGTGGSSNDCSGNTGDPTFDWAYTTGFTLAHGQKTATIQINVPVDDIGGGTDCVWSGDSAPDPRNLARLTGSLTYTVP
jgi:hypothetical protein